MNPFPFPLWKVCTENIELTDYDGTSVQIEKGTKVLVPFHSLHLHPELYPEPNTFNPDRFDESSGHGLKYYKDAGAFTPFGNGPRSCLGKRQSASFGIKLQTYEKIPFSGLRFATLQIKAAICELLKHFELRPTTEHEAISAGTGMFFFTDASTEVEFRRL